ncbi:MAG: DUF4236 domain-containing protein [Paludibacteraceae bacterium]|nr:DUF4236 domain-containing protein [Paludibacteraceae bacterium]
MAWAWRKRKSIIPGVRLNFGRKGISTTIGPRGASMTFGPNGTYLNTSIPGTGLYNRQKIGNNNNVQMTNDNTGCKDFFIKILSFSLWLLVVVLALMGFAINAWVGCAFVVTLILTHVIVAIIAKNKGIQSEDQPSQASQPIKNNHEITEEYYNQVTKVVEDVYAVYEKVLKLPNIESLVNSMGVQFSMNNSPMTNIKEKVLLMFQVDLTRCYDGLGHLIDLSSKEGLGLFYFIALTKGCPPGRPFENLSIAKAVYQSDAESILKGIKIYIDSAPALSEVFFISRLLASNDTELHRKFLVAMYRFASITAKADNTVTSEEAEWLGNIMKLQENSGQEIVQAEDEDEQFDIPTNVPHIPNLDPMFADIARWIVKNQVGATSSIQRQFEIGYNRAGKIADQLEMAGIIGPNNGTNGRDVLISNPVQLEQLLIGLQGEDGANSNKTSSPEKGKTTTTKSRTQNPSKELNSLIGLASVKTEVETLTNFIKIQQTRAAKGLKTSAVSYHCVFTGNPGTGKTTVARILAKIYKKLGVVSKGHLVETDRAGLVAEYVGQTAVKTNKIIDSALDGVLFIDEAYSLISGSENDFGKEAIATLLKRMEDNRDRLIVILAGYTKNMKDFIDSNPGLQSRFNRYIEFPDYSADELLQIFEANMKKYEYRFGEGAREYLQQYFENEVAHKDANFGNGRLVRNVFEKSLERQANRLAREVNLTTDRLSQIEIEDLPQS